MTLALVRLPHLSRTQFQRYWLDRHAPLVRAVGGALAIRGYVQVHVVEHMPTGTAQGSPAPQPVDGLAEVWFDSPEALRIARGTLAGADAIQRLREDEARFIDSNRTVTLWGTEHRIIWPPASGLDAACGDRRGEASG